MLGKKASVKVICQELKQHQVTYDLQLLSHFQFQYIYIPLLMTTLPQHAGSRCLNDSVRTGADPSLGGSMVL